MRKTITGNKTGLLFATKDVAIMGETFTGNEVGIITSSELLTGRKRTIEDVTEEGLNWLQLFRQKPSPNDSITVWLLRLEQAAGITLLENKPTSHLYRHLSVLEEPDDDELSEIETSNIDREGLESSYSESLFD